MGSACSGSASTSSHRRSGASRANDRIAGTARWNAADWNDAIRARARDLPGHRGEVGLGALDALEERLGVTGEDEPGVGEAHPASGPFEEWHAGLPLEHRELLGHGRRGVLQRVRHRGDRSALPELAEQTQSVQIEHSEEMLPIDRYESALLLLAWGGRIGRMPRAGALLCLASAAAFGAMGIFGKLAYGDGATVGTLLACRFVLAATLFWLVVLATGGRADSAPCPGATWGSRSRWAPSATGRRRGPTSPRSSGSTPPCSGSSSTRSR